MIEKEKYAVHVEGCKEKFETWIRERGGVIVWRTQDLSDPSRGDMFTPALLPESKKAYPKPHWAFAVRETVQDITRFRFIREMKELQRFHIAVRMGRQGMKVKVTEASTRRIEKALAKWKEKIGQECVYQFDYEYQECVILQPIWGD